MTGTVTVGFDGSAESQAAVDWAALEAERQGLPLRLVHVWRWQPHTLGTDPDKEHEWIEHVPRRAARRLVEHHPGLEVEHLSVPGVPADVLIDLTEESSLLVLGSRALSRASGFLLGSVGQEVTARAEGPVVLVRASYEDEEMREDRSLPDQHSAGPVVVGLDLVQPSRAVLQFAFEAAALRGVGVRAVHVWKLPAVFTYGPRMIDQHQRSDLAQREHHLLSTALLPWCDKYPQVPVDERAAPGNAARHLIEWADDTSLLVVGRRMRRPALGARLGARHPGCPAPRHASGGSCPAHVGVPGVRAPEMLKAGLPRQLPAELPRLMVRVSPGGTVTARPRTEKRRGDRSESGRLTFSVSPRIRTLTPQCSRKRTEKLVDRFGGECAADPVARHGGLGTQGDQQNTRCRCRSRRSGSAAYPS